MLNAHPTPTSLSFFLLLLWLEILSCSNSQRSKILLLLLICPHAGLSLCWEWRCSEHAMFLRLSESRKWTDLLFRSCSCRPSAKSGYWSSACCEDTPDTLSRTLILTLSGKASWFAYYYVMQSELNDDSRESGVLAVPFRVITMLHSHRIRKGKNNDNNKDKQ